MRWGSALLRNASALAAVAFHAFAPIKPEPAREGHSPYRKPHGKKNRPGRSGQKAAMDRLIPDRSSTVHKMQRWLNNGTLQMAAPKTERHLQRHGWYRRQQRRAAAKEAWNATT